MIPPIDAVEALYREADGAVARFSEGSGYRCPTVCGRCCESPYIEATALECLPLARTLLPKAEQWLEDLDRFLARGRTLPSPCPFYVTFGFGKGFCSVYESRPLICRLFGFAAYREQSGRTRLDVCHYHHERRTPVPDPEGAPFYRDYRRKAEALAPELSVPQGIASAVREALGHLVRSVSLISPAPGSPG